MVIISLSDNEALRLRFSFHQRLEEVFLQFKLINNTENFHTFIVGNHVIYFVTCCLLDFKLQNNIHTRTGLRQQQTETQKVL